MGKPEIWQQFLSNCAKYKTKAELENFFNLILTPSEKDEFAKRLQIILALLKDDLPQREIAKTLQVSIANVSRGSNVIKNSSTDLKKLLKINK